MEQGVEREPVLLPKAVTYLRSQQYCEARFIRQDKTVSSRLGNLEAQNS